MKKLIKYFCVSLLLIFSMAIIICFPQFYYFDNTINYKNFSLYYDKAFPINTTSILDSVENKIRKSEIYDAKTRFKIFIRSDYSIHNMIPWQFSDSAYAITRPIIRNIFISKGDLQSNRAYKVSGGSRPLDEIIAHEITHVFIEKNYMWDRGKFPENWSKSRFLWKEEGYADYIAGGTSLNDKQGLDILEGKSNTNYNIYELEYFKYWYAVNYLIKIKHISVGDLINSRLSLDSVLDEAINAKN